MRGVLGLLVGGLLLPAAPALACVTASGETALIHSALPARLPPDTIVAEVDISVGDAGALYTSGLPARVIRMVQGEMPLGHFLTLRWGHASSCDRPFANGSRGYIIARARPRPDNPLLVEPFPVVRSKGFRMDDDGRIPEEWLADPPGW